MAATLLYPPWELSGNSYLPFQRNYYQSHLQSKFQGPDSRHSPPGDSSSEFTPGLEEPPRRLVSCRKCHFSHIQSCQLIHSPSGYCPCWLGWRRSYWVPLGTTKSSFSPISHLSSMRDPGRSKGSESSHWLFANWWDQHICPIFASALAIGSPNRSPGISQSSIRLTWGRHQAPSPLLGWVYHA